MLIVVEGYMDVIASAQAGFTGAVAPLGTALTMEQLEELWRVSPCPVLCFDGDPAGARAAARAMELALPLLTVERSMKFATLPANEDPDSLVRKGGARAFQAYLDAAASPVDDLYRMVRGEVGDTTPEKRAALQSKLEAATAKIADKPLRWEYLRTLRGKLDDSQPTRSLRRDGKRGMPVARLSHPGPSVPRPALDVENTAAERMRILTAILLRHPFLVHDVAVAYAALAMDARLARLREAIEAWAESAETLDSADLMNHLTSSGFALDVQYVLAEAPMPLPACASAKAMPAEAESGWWHIFGFLNVDHLREEVALAEADAMRNLTPETQRRQIALAEALCKVRSGEPDAVGMVDA